MTKSLLISIQPQWLYKILKGDKTSEVRKVVPKWVLEALDRGETVEAYLYCTKGKPILYRTENYGGQHKKRFSYNLVPNISVLWTNENLLNGTIPVKVVIDGYEIITKEEIVTDKFGFDETEEEYMTDTMREKELLEKTCLQNYQLWDYMLCRDKAYALHISKVEILDEVMKLGDFYKSWSALTCGYILEREELTKAPQNMMSVWVK